MKNLVKYSLWLALFSCAVSPVYAASQKVEEAKARAAIRDELDWDALKQQEKEKAREAIRREIDKDAIKRELERNAVEMIRAGLDLGKLTQSEEENVRQRVRSSIDERTIYGEEFNRIAQRVYAERFHPSQMAAIMSDIQHRKYAEIEEAVKNRIREEVTTKAKADAESKVYPVAYQEQSRAIYQRVVAQFLKPEIRGPIEAKARAEEIQRIEADEKARVRVAMQAAIRAEIEKRCDSGEIKLVSDEERARINAEIVEKKTKIAAAKYRETLEREYQVSLSDEQRRAIQKSAFDKVVGTESERFMSKINGRKLELTAEVQFRNRFIRLFNWFMLFPGTRITEWNEPKFVQDELSKDFLRDDFIKEL